MEKITEIFKNSKWISSSPVKNTESVVYYEKEFELHGELSKAELYITACGVYSAELNGNIVSMPLAPGFDSYLYKMPYQVYDVNNSLFKGGKINTLRVCVARGWYGWFKDERAVKNSDIRAFKAVLALKYKDNRCEYIATDNQWLSFGFKCVKSDIYNGEYFDASAKKSDIKNAVEISCFENDLLTLYDGDEICENERIVPVAEIITPLNEYVIDFGQEITGYVEINIPDGAVSEGDIIDISHAEMLDKFGNFYNENYRGAKAELTYVCKSGKQKYKPLCTFFCFRYIRLNKRPENINKNNFRAVVVHTKLERTGYIESSSAILNRFVENVIWGQKDNFLDIPTDCPQRDERLGWTGDAQIFCRAANYNFDCERFFRRWLKMLECEQSAFGCTPDVVPNVSCRKTFSSVWSDASVIVPWEVYRAYGDKRFLEEFYPVMERHIRAIGEATSTRFLWTGSGVYGDWLALDGNNGYYGASDKDFISSAYYAYSLQLTILAGKELGKDVSEYLDLYNNVRNAVINTYTPKTQTECVLALYFNLTNDKKVIAKRLAEKIRQAGNSLQTGFVGTPYLLFALSENGYTELAYELLLKEDYPSWLYPVKCGATTVWEHWDGRNENGDFWPPEMNSFNHYAYGAVVAWIYSVAAGITPLESGYRKIKIEPNATDKLQFLSVRFKTRYGEVFSAWKHVSDYLEYEIFTPVEAVVVIENDEYKLSAGERRIFKIRKNRKSAVAG